MFRSTYASSNVYRMEYEIQKMNSREIWVYSACHGVRAKYYPVSTQVGDPVVDRIEPFLPSQFDYTFRKMSHFRADFEFVYSQSKPGSTSI